MQTVYLGNTLINDFYLVSQRMDDVLHQKSVLNINFLVAAAGGAGGAGGGFGGGGGAGRYLASTASLQPSNYSIVVGTAISDSTGGNSTFLDITCNGGGLGGNGNTSGAAGNGSNGGSGGGGGDGAGRNGGSPISATGSYGIGNGSSGGSNRPGGGGGASGAGDGTNGGGGLTWVDGNTYCQGGNPGTNRVAKTTYGSGGYGRDTGSANSQGLNGIVIIRYSGTPIASGGTITQSGGYTYHTFTSNGTFTY